MYSSQRQLWPYLLLFALIPRASSAQTPTVVQGRITDSLKTPLAGVEVTITGDDATHKATTNAEGHFSALFVEGPRRFFLVGRKVGYEPFSWGAQAANGQQVVNTSAILNRSLITLPNLNSIARAPTQQLENRLPAALGGSEVTLNTQNMILTNPGDLDEIWATLFRNGLGDSTSGDRTVTIDGMKFDGSLVPPDAMRTLRLSNTSSDIARNTTGGQELSVATARGSDVFASTMRASGTDHHLAWKDPLSSIEPPTKGTFSGFVSGPIVRGNVHQFLSWSLTDAATPVHTLLNPLSAHLADIGLSGDTLARLTTVMSALGIPATVPGVSSSAHTRSGSLSLNIDGQANATTMVSLLLVPSWSRTDGGGLASSFPTSGRTDANYKHFASLHVNSFFAGMVSDLKSAGSFARLQSHSEGLLPGGTVQVGTTYADGRDGLTTLGFGGSGGSIDIRTNRWETRHELSFSIANGKHQLRFGQSLELNWNHQLFASNLLGSYLFQSLSSLAEDTPESYTRNIDNHDHSLQTTAVGAWLGDVWRAHPRLGIEGGLRIDHFDTGLHPELNADVQSAFGQRTDFAPTFTTVSPKIGFAWIVAKHPFDINKLLHRVPGTNILSKPAIGVGSGTVSDGVVREGGLSGYRLFGTIGLTHGGLNADRLMSYLDATGLQGSPRTLICVGDATPIPQWGSDAVAPTSCRDGTGPTTFGSSLPQVRVFDRKFQLPTTWKASLGFGGVMSGSWTFEPAILLMSQTHSGSTLNLNLRNTSVFNLADEGGRPVFVSPAQIDSRSGAIAPAANRLNPTFGDVLSSVSDLRNQSAQFSFKAYTEKVIATFPLQVEYQFRLGRSQVRGMGEDPRSVEWMSSSLPVHQIAIGSNGYRIWWFTLGATLRISSGEGYTPTVVGDVNGDGRSYDKAFVPDPAHTSDPELASQMRALLAGAPSSARACLEKQLGSIAGTGSCRSGWRSQMDMRLEFSPPASFGLSQRIKITTRLADAGGAIVRLLGLRNTPLGTATQDARPDNRLLYVTGFDPVAQRFQYRVNTSFGQPVETPGGHTKIGSFQLELGAQYQFGVKPARNDTRRLGFFNGDGTPKSHEEIRAILHKENVRDPAQKILDMADTLDLTAKQRADITVIRDAFEVKADTLLEPLVSYVIKESRNMVDQAYYQQVNTVGFNLSLEALAAQEKAVALLNAEQKARLTAPIAKKPVRN